jgi:Protein of unknown function (DUF3237)
MNDRRDWLKMASMMGMASVVPPGIGAENSGPKTSALPAGARMPALEYVLEGDVTLGPTIETGNTWEGSRRIYPITGGTFQGPDIRGKVLSGADWNLKRIDGAETVEAIFYLVTDDGATLRYVDRGAGVAAKRDPDAAEHFLMFTQPTIEAPVGKYDWMNKTLFVGTIGQRRGASRQSTLFRLFKVV